MGRPLNSGKVYFNGKPCPKGHKEGRFVRNKSCVVCQRELIYRWQKINPDRRRHTCLRWVREKLPVPSRLCPKSCEICGKVPSRTMHLDHDHLKNSFRGWLCPDCNTGIGKLGDNIAGLERALDYLRRNGSS